MAALDFPNPPLTVGQQFTATNGTAYQWDGAVWMLVPLAGASGPAGGDLTGSFPAPQIAPGAVDDDEIANVAWTKLIAPLLGTIPLTPRSGWSAGATLVDWHGNVPGDPAADNTKPSWIIRIDYGNDVFQVWRAPPPGTAWALLFQVALSGITMNVPISLPANSVGSAQIVDGSIQAGDLAPGAIGPGQLAGGAVGRGQLGVNAVNGAPAYVAVPTSYVLNSPGWNTYVTLPALATRGGFVHLWIAAGLSVTAGTGGNVWTRWLCDGAQVVSDVHQVAGTGVYASVPDLAWLHNPAAGTHTYAYQVAVDPGMTMISTNIGGGGALAVEIG